MMPPEDKPARAIDDLLDRPECFVDFLQNPKQQYIGTFICGMNQQKHNFGREMGGC